jgi:hypothetical protein
MDMPEGTKLSQRHSLDPDGPRSIGWSTLQPGAVIEGVLRKMEKRGEHDSTFLEIELDGKHDNEVVSVSAPTVILDKIKVDRPLGHWIKIVFKGKREGKKYYDFDVFVSDSPVA